MQKFVHDVLSDFFTKGAPDRHHRNLNSSFGAFLFWLGAFGTVSLLHKTFCKTRQTGAINAKVRATMSCKNFFTTNAPDPHHWTLNSCFGAFLSIWVLLGPFRYCTKLGAKWANLLQLMQNFVPQSLVRISRNLCSRSTQLDSKLMFSCVSFCLGAFGTVSVLHKTRNKTGNTGAINGKVRATMSSYNFTQRTLQICTTGP